MFEHMSAGINLDHFSPHLFWDVDKQEFDMNQFGAQLVYRVVEYGTMKDWELLQKIYTRDELKAMVMDLRDLDKVTLSFLAHYFKVDKNAFRCYKQSQSPQSFWNS